MLSQTPYLTLRAQAMVTGAGTAAAQGEFQNKN